MLITQLSFPYIEDHGFYRPKVPVILSASGIKTKVLGLLDSGSDYVLIPKGVAEAVGISVKGREEESDGIGGRITCRSGIATITVRKGKVSKTIRNMRVRVPVSGESDFDEILLGRIPFFKFFKIEFNENARRVVLKPVRRAQKEE